MMRCVYDYGDDDDGDWVILDYAARYFYQWREYTLSRRRKCEDINFARGFYFSKILKKYFLRWSKHSRSAINDRWSTIIDCDSRYFCIDYKLKIMQYYFSRWKKYCSSKSHKRLLKSKALNYYKTSQCKQSFNVWLHQLDRRNCLISIATTRLSNLGILQRHFDCWLKFVRVKQEHLNKITLADEYYSLVLMTKVISVLKENKSISIWKKSLKKRAEIIYFHHLKSLYLRKWYEQLRKEKDIEIMGVVANKHLQHFLFEKYFSYWHCKYLERRKTAYYQDIAIGQYELNLCRKVFLKLWANTFIAKQQSFSDQIAVAHDMRTCVRRHFHLWKQYLTYRKRKASVTTKADHFNQIMLKRSAMLSWRRNCAVILKQKLQISILESQEQQQILKKFFQRWLARMAKSQSQNLKILQCNRHYRTTLLLRILKVWHNWSRVHSHKRQETELKIKQAQEKLQLNILRRKLQKWKQQRDAKILENLLIASSDIYHHQRLLRMAFIHWKNYCEDLQRRELMMLGKVATWRDSMLMRRCWHRWHSQVEGAIAAQKSKNNVALWFWSYNLLAKIFRGWWLHCQQQTAEKPTLRGQMRFTDLGASDELGAGEASGQMSTGECSRMPSVAESLPTQTVEDQTLGIGGREDPNLQQEKGHLSGRTTCKQKQAHFFQHGDVANAGRQANFDAKVCQIANHWRRWAKTQAQNRLLVSPSDRDETINFAANISFMNSARSKQFRAQARIPRFLLGDIAGPGCGSLQLEAASERDAENAAFSNRFQVNHQTTAPVLLPPSAFVSSPLGNFQKKEQLNVDKLQLLKTQLLSVRELKDKLVCLKDCRGALLSCNLSSTSRQICLIDSQIAECERQIAVFHPIVQNAHRVVKQVDPN